jgi:hypothetical protein
VVHRVVADGHAVEAGDILRERAEALGPVKPFVWKIQVSMKVLPPAGKLAIELIPSHACRSLQSCCLRRWMTSSRRRSCPKKPTGVSDTVTAVFAATANGGRAIRTLIAGAIEEAGAVQGEEPVGVNSG